MHQANCKINCKAIKWEERARNTEWQWKRLEKPWSSEQKGAILPLYFRCTVIFFSANKDATPYMKATLTRKLFQDHVWDPWVSGGRHNGSSAGCFAKEMQVEEVWTGQPRIKTSDRRVSAAAACPDLHRPGEGGAGWRRQRWHSSNWHKTTGAPRLPATKFHFFFFFLEVVRDQLMPPSPFQSRCLWFLWSPKAEEFSPHSNRKSARPQSENHRLMSCLRSGKKTSRAYWAALKKAARFNTSSSRQQHNSRLQLRILLWICSENTEK